MKSCWRYLSTFKIALCTLSGACNGVVRWKFCNHNSVQKLMESFFRWGGAYGGLASMTFSFFLSFFLFFSFFVLKNALLNQKSIVLFFIYICDLVLFYMIFILIPFVNFKFVFDFTLDRNFNFSYFFVLIFFVKCLDIFNFTLESMNVICPFIFLFRVFVLILFFFFGAFC